MKLNALNAKTRRRLRPEVRTRVKPARIQEIGLRDQSLGKNFVGPETQGQS